MALCLVGAVLNILGALLQNFNEYLHQMYNLEYILTQRLNHDGWKIFFRSKELVVN